MFDQIVGFFFIIQRQCVVRLLADDANAGEVVPQRVLGVQQRQQVVLERLPPRRRPLPRLPADV